MGRRDVGEKCILSSLLPRELDARNEMYLLSFTARGISNEIKIPTLTSILAPFLFYFVYSLLLSLNILKHKFLSLGCTPME